jgi:hypothetical protein
LKTDWSIRNGEDGIDQAVERYKRYLENRGFRPTTIRVHSSNLRRYFKFFSSPKVYDGCSRMHMRYYILSHSTDLANKQEFYN